MYRQKDEKSAQMLITRRESVDINKGDTQDKGARVQNKSKL
jgi:hypothetical protein